MSRRKDKRIDSSESSKTYEQLSCVKVVGKLCGDRDVKLRLVEFEEDLQESSHHPNIVCVSAAKSHFLCLSDEGTVFVCGQGIAGQLGLGKEKRTSSQLCQTIFTPQTFIVDITCGFAQSAAISASGDLYLWGSGYSASWEPQLFQIDKFDVTQCALGNSHTLIIGHASKDTGRDLQRVFGLGDNQFGQLGMENPVYKEFTPITELDKMNIVSVACGYQHSIAITDDGLVYFWGTFHVDNEPIRTPTLVTLQNDEKVITCSSCDDAALLLTESGKLYIYGYRSKEDLSREFYSKPTLVEEFGNQTILQVSSESRGHVISVVPSLPNTISEVYIWGDLGKKGSDIGARIAGKPILLDELSKQVILQLACGSRFTVILTDNRNAGQNKQHQFEKIQMNLPVRCHICSHFAFGLRHGLWKCTDCGLMCHTKCKDDSLDSICEPNITQPASPTISESKKHSRESSRGSSRTEIEEQEAQVMRRWAKAQSDFASDFVRHISTTKLHDLAGFERLPAASPVQSATPPTPPATAASPVSSPIQTSTETQPRTRRLRSRTDFREEKTILPLTSSTDSQEEVPLSLDEDDKAKRIQSIMGKLSYYRKKVNDLENELNMLLGPGSTTNVKGPLSNLTSVTNESGLNDFTQRKTDDTPTLTSVSLPITILQEYDINETTRGGEEIPKTSPVTVVQRTDQKRLSTRPSDRLSLSKTKLSIDKAWTIDPAQVQIEKQLGEGASAIVYLGQYRGQNVAIKVMKDRVGNKRLHDFQFEFHILREMKSKYNVYFYGACLNPNLCLLMEFCERGSLYSFLNDTNQRLKWPRMLKIALEMCRGVSCLHSWEPQIVHRDLKSHNLLIDENWNVKIADFGLARLNTGTMKKNTLSKLRGTYTYCAPEIYYGYPFTARSDVFSIGVILWEMVVRAIKGRYERPYSEFSELEYDFQIIVQTARGKRCTIPPTTPVPLVKLIRACWEDEPSARPTAKELVASIQNIHRDYRANQEAWDWAILK